MSDARAKRLVIAAGGTGGHMFPAQALAEEMVRRGWRVTLSTDERGGRYAGGFPGAVDIREVSSATFSRGGIIERVATPIRILAGIVAAKTDFLRNRPAVVVGFGGYPSIPAISAAWLLRIPRMIHEQNGVLGRVNRIFAPRVDRVACGTWPTDLPKGVTGIPTGNPIRNAVRDHAGAAYRPPGDGLLNVLVIGGSQGARVFSEVVPKAIEQLPADMQRHLSLTQQARDEDVDGVRRIYERAGISAEVETFFDDVPERLAKAQLVIARAGASTIAEIAAVGRPAILVPYAFATEDHQTANARALVDTGAAVLIPDGKLEPALLSEQMTEILGDPDRAEKMAEKARQHGRADATERLVALVEQLAGKQT